MVPSLFENPNSSKRPKKLSRTVQALIGFGVSLLLSCFCCIGGSYYVFLETTSAVAEKFKLEIANHDVIVKEIGEIEEFEFEFETARAINRDSNGKQNSAFRIKGAKGAGLVVARLRGSQGFDNVQLKLNRGEIIPIDLESNP